jgi:putative hydrolase of the HAD superfamily
MYQHLFFDLDHTLWDFETNASLTLTQLFEDFRLGDLTDCTIPGFLATFHRINYQLWADFDTGRISQATLRESRFRLVFEACGLSKFAQNQEFADLYLQICPTQPHLLPHTQEVLMYLKEKNYRLHILTNGFPDTQTVKLKSGGILHFFENVITSDLAGSRKPDRRMFDMALQTANALPTQSLMTGDTLETDIAGAINAGWDTVFFNPGHKKHRSLPTFEIQSLREMTAFL